MPAKKKQDGDPKSNSEALNQPSEKPQAEPVASPKTRSKKPKAETLADQKTPERPKSSGPIKTPEKPPVPASESGVQEIPQADPVKTDSPQAESAPARRKHWMQRPVTFGRKRS